MDIATLGANEAHRAGGLLYYQEMATCLLLKYTTAAENPYRDLRKCILGECFRVVEESEMSTTYPHSSRTVTALVTRHIRCDGLDLFIPVCFKVLAALPCCCATCSLLEQSRQSYFSILLRSSRFPQHAHFFQRLRGRFCCSRWSPPLYLHLSTISPSATALSQTLARNFEPDTNTSTTMNPSTTPSGTPPGSSTIAQPSSPTSPSATPPAKPPAASTPSTHTSTW